jgi:hypothetical protein
VKIVWALIFFATCTFCSGVLGFCLGGLLGPRLFGSGGGHGLAELGYLFGGAALGLLAGIAVGVVGLVRKWEPVLRFIVSASLGVGATAITLLVAAIGW